MTALHVFDMDGTLLRDTTANLEVARRLGCVDETLDLEERFGAGLIDVAGLVDGLGALWGGLTPDAVADAVDAAPWIAGIDAVCADISARGETSMLVTLSPAFFAEHLHRRGVDVVRGAGYPALPFDGPLDPGALVLLAPTDKVHLVDAELARRDLGRHACVAYGDSVSDGPLFAALEHTVAANASAAIEAAAAVAWHGDDLRGAYARGRALLDGVGR